MNSETWYEIEVSHIGDDNWCSGNVKADTLEGARKLLWKPVEGFALRIVKVTQTREAVE